jgi:hypothetical protein
MVLQPTDSNPGHQEYLRTLLPKENGAVPTGIKYQGNKQEHGLLMPSEMYTKMQRPEQSYANRPPINYSSPTTTHYSANQGNLYI